MVAALLGAGALGALVAVQGGDVSVLVHAGSRYTGAGPTGPVVRPGDGYDRQFVYRTAVAPLSDHDRVAGVAYDSARV